MLKIIRRIARGELAGPLGLLLLVIGMLHRALFSGGKLLAALSNTDLHLQFLGWRFFGFSQWKHGHFPLWDPRIFCGIPFFAQMQSALLYPICWVHFIFSPGVGCNLEIAITIFLAALFMYCWCRQRELSRCAATLAGAVFAFSGPVYLHVMAGHLAPLASMAWAPLVFFSVDRLLEGRFRSGFLLGSVSVCLQIFGGAPQYVYYTAICVGLYLLLQAMGRPRFWRPILWCAGIYLGGTLLAAAQLIPAYRAAQTSIRAGGTSYQFASTLSLPPENLLSLLVPYPLGDLVHLLYLGRWYMWETSVYAGVITLVLACIGLASLRRGQWWRMSLLVCAMLLLAVGSYTPVHRFLYSYLPGFDLFRGASKFSMLVALLLSVLAAHGFDRIRFGGAPKLAIAVTPIAGAILLGFVIYLLQMDPRNGLISKLMYGILRSDQYYFNYPSIFDLAHVEALTRWMAREFAICAVLLLITGALLYLRRHSRKFVFVLLALAIVEVFAAASQTNPISSLNIPYPDAWTVAVRDAAANDQRLIASRAIDNNIGFSIGANFLWGYDPGLPQRYAELFAASQNAHPTNTGQYNSLQLTRISRIFRLLRCRYVLTRSEKYPVRTINDPLPHVQLVGSYIKLTRSKAILAKLKDANFHYRQSVVLETDPEIKPTPLGATGQVQLIRQSINHLEIEANLPSPAILLVTDAYAPGWTVQPLEPNPNQPHYHVLRADYVLRAIPLAAGHHHFILAYRPRSVVAGFTVTLISLIGLAILIWFWRGKTADYETGSR